MNSNPINPKFSFIDCLDSSALVLNSQGEVVHQNRKAMGHSQKLFENSDWKTSFDSCLQTSTAKFLNKTNLHEFMMTRICMGPELYVLVQPVDLNLAGESLPELIMNEYRASQVRELVEMSASIAHEINNPLTVIAVRTQMLTQVLASNGEITNEKLAQYFEKMTAQSDRIKGLVDGMRAFARNLGNNNELECDLRTLVNDAFKLVSSGIKEKNVTFKFETDVAEMPLTCRPSELIQIFINMFNNSIYALAQEPDAKISLIVEEDPHYYNFYFSDNGPGIAADIQDKIFTPFFTTKPIGVGPGLGLSMAGKILQSYGGSIKLDRTRGKSCFHIQLLKTKGTQDKVAQPMPLKKVS